MKGPLVAARRGRCSGGSSPEAGARSTLSRIASRLLVLGVLLVLSCGRDTPTGPRHHALSGPVVLTGFLVDNFGEFRGTRVVGDADGVPVDLTDGAHILARTTTVDGSYRFEGLTPGAYLAQSRVLAAIADHTGMLTVAVSDLVSEDTLRLVSVGDLRPVPNPAYPWTDLYFELPDSQTVNVRILDMEGRTVRQLLVARLPPRLHRVWWDGRDEAGQEVNGTLYWGTVVTPVASQAQLLFRYTPEQAARLGRSASTTLDDGDARLERERKRRLAERGRR